jgi:predicted transcriptional regulator of viral defense system
MMSGVMLGEREVFARLPDHLIGQGRYTATTEEITRLTGRDADAVRHGLARLRRQGRLFSPARGFHVVVPPEYRSWKAVPADWFVDDLMAYLRRSYYVGLLSAASLHGASHQAPQVFQIVTEREHHDRDFGRVRLRFYQSAWVPKTPTIVRNSHTGTLKVSTPEATVVDLVDRPRDGGGLSNIATIVKEIEPLEGAELARLSALRPRAHARRLGWLLQHFRDDVDLAPLRRAAEPEAGKPVALSPGSRRPGPLDRRWGVRVNTEVEPDV